MIVLKLKPTNYSRDIMPILKENIFDGDEVKAEHITNLIRLIETQTDEWHWAHFGWFETDREGIIYTINSKEIYWVVSTKSEEQKLIVHDVKLKDYLSSLFEETIESTIRTT
jgi:hypothetical protein